jgi:hypothetical protein
LSIVVPNKILDLGYQLFHAAESTATDGLLRDDVEPDFHLVEPRSIGRCVVHLKPRVRRQPAEHAGMLVRGVIIHDQVHSEPGRNLGVDLAQEAQVLLVAMAALTLTEDRAGRQVQCRKQGGRAVANIVVGYAFDIPQAHGKQGLGALQESWTHRIKGFRSEHQGSGSERSKSDGRS